MRNAADQGFLADLGFPVRRWAAWLVAFVLALCVLELTDLGATRAHAAAIERPPPERIWLQPGPEVSLLTFGPGDAAFFKFGHNAIRVTYPNKGPDLVYNFGTFRFDNPLLILDFLTGKFKYWLSVAPFPPVLAAYRSENRDVIEQQLNLNRPDAWDTAEALADNARPEHRFYLYDYYRDNCSTRVRDVIDKATGDALKERNQGPGTLSLRDHTLRLVADDFWLYVGLDIAMGSYIDQRETRYSEMFLPERLSDAVGAVVFSGAHGTAPLVKKRIAHYESEGRPQLRTRPPARTTAFLEGGLAIGGAWLFLAWEAYRRRQRWAQALLALTLGAFGLVAGILGLLFLGLWLFTNHVVSFHNENILQCAPWALGLPITAWGLWKGRPKAIIWSYRLVQAGMAASVLGLVCKVFPFMAQHNERIIALFVPVWCGAFAALTLLRLRIVRPLLVPVNDVVAAQVTDEEPVPSEREPRESKSPKRPTSVRPPPKAEDEQEEAEQRGPSPSQRPAPA
jgi:Domain of unknown function (DUF4105)